MPKGYNKDGSKKVRPANSGRKVKEGKKIHSKLAIDVIQILAKQLDPIGFLCNAVREKAARASGQKQSDPFSSSRKNAQIDLVDLIAEIKAENKAV